MRSEFLNDLLEAEAALLEEKARQRQQKAKVSMQRAFDQLPVPQVALLLKSGMQPWESLESLLFRVAKLNHLSGISLLNKSLGMPSGSFVGQVRNRNEQLQMCTGSTSEALSAAMPIEHQAGTVRLYGHMFLESVLALKKHRICIMCLAAHGYGRAYWTLAPLAVCEEHHCYLIDQCPACDAQLGETRPEYRTCRCGADLTKHLPRQASKAATSLSNVIVSLFKRQVFPLESEHGGLNVEYLMSMELTELLQLVVFLGAISNSRRAMTLQLNRRTVSMSSVIHQFDQAASALADWPRGLFPILRQARVFTKRQETPVSVYSSLNHVQDLAMDKLSPSSFTLVSEGIAAFLNTPLAWRVNETAEVLEAC